MHWLIMHTHNVHCYMLLYAQLHANAASMTAATCL